MDDNDVLDDEEFDLLDDEEYDLVDDDDYDLVDDGTDVVADADEDLVSDGLLAVDDEPEPDTAVVGAPLTSDRRTGPLDWSEVGRSMRRFWRPLLPLAAVAVVLALTIGQSESDVFRSEVDLVFAPSVDLPETYETADALDILNDRVLQGTYIELTESRTLRRAAVQVGGLDEDLLADSDVDGSIAQEANVVTVGVEAPSSADAVSLSTSLAEVTIERFQQLYPIIEVSVVDEPTVPEGPAGTNVFQAVVLALAAAFFVWVILAVVLGRLRS